MKEREKEREREQLKNSALICDTKNNDYINEKNAKRISIVNRKVAIKNKIKRMDCFSKIQKRSIEEVFLLNRLSFLCVKDKYA